LQTRGDDDKRKVRGEAKKTEEAFNGKRTAKKKEFRFFDRGEKKIV